MNETTDPRPPAAQLLEEASRLHVAVELTKGQVDSLARYIRDLEARADNRLRLVGSPSRQVFCPTCNQVRGCEHLAAELEQLRAGRVRPVPAACPHCAASPLITVGGVCATCRRPTP